MNNQIPFFNYNTSPEKLYDKYVPICDRHIQLPYKSGSRIFSHPPKSIVLIQMVAVAAFAALAISLSPVPALSIALTASAVGFIGYRIYKFFFCIDPLLDAFYKICGGKEKFDKPGSKLHIFQLRSSSLDEISIQDQVNFLEAANSISCPIYRAFSSDCRRDALLIKGPENKLFVFLEQLSPLDFKNISLSKKIMSIAKGLLSFKNYSESITIGNIEMAGSMSTDMANEFFLQNKYILLPVEI